MIYAGAMRQDPHSAAAGLLQLVGLIGTPPMVEIASISKKQQSKKSTKNFDLCREYYFTNL